MPQGTTHLGQDIGLATPQEIINMGSDIAGRPSILTENKIGETGRREPAKSWAKPRTPNPQDITNLGAE